MKLNTPVSELMSKKIVSVKPGDKLHDVKHLFQSGSFHYNLPVIENDELKGMVELNDFMFALRNEAAAPGPIDYSKLTVKDIMHEKVTVITPQTTVLEAAGLFSNGERHTVMVAEQGKLLGIVSSADVIRWLIDAQQ